jgi:iron complex outermembrane receptor protein
MRPLFVFRSVALLLALGFAAPAGAQNSLRVLVGGTQSPAARGAAPSVRADQPGLERRITIKLGDTPLESALEEIARQVGITLGYPADLLPKAKRVSLHLEDRPAGEALTEVLRQTGLAVRVLPGGVVTLIRQGNPKPARTQLQTGTITGRVTDAATGTALQGVSVRLGGTQRSALTGADGRFRVEQVPAGTYTLVASRLGYVEQSQQVTVATEQTATADFALSASALPLEEVVVTGTVVPTEVRALPTPISVITAETLQRQNIARVDQVFRGQVPGSISWDQGASDHYSSIMVRGASSLQVNSIKTYVDGIELSSSAFALIDPNSIERIEVIRGPQASTIYGSDASGGVMQIFTKKGDPRLARPEISAKLSLGAIQSPYASRPTVRHDHSVTLLGGDSVFGYNLGASYVRTGEWLPEYSSSSPGLFAGARMTQGPLTFSLSARAVNKGFAVTQSPAAVATGYRPFSQPLYLDSRISQQTYGAFLGYVPTTWWEHNLTLGVDQAQTENTRNRPRLTTPADTFLSVTNAADGKTSIAYNTSVHAPLRSGVTGSFTVGADRYERWSTSTIASRALTTAGSIATDPRFPPLAARNRITNTGSFGQAQLDFRDVLFLTAGVRADWNSGIGVDYGAAIAPRAGVTYVHDLGLVTAKLRAAYGQGIRAPLPTQRDARQSASSLQLANPELGPERQLGGDGGLDLQFGRRASLGITYYDQTAIDLIDLVLVDASTSPPSYQYQNVGRIQNRGWEFQGGLTFPQVALRGTYSLTNSTVRRLSPSYSGDLRVDDQVLLVPRRTGGASLTLAPLSGTTLSAVATYVGSWTSYDYLELYDYYYGGRPFRGSMRNYWREYPSFVKANLSVNQTLRSNVETFLAVENVGNSTPVEQNNLFTTYGRATTLGIRVRY